MEGHIVVRKQVELPFADVPVVVVDDKLVSMASVERMFQTTKKTVKEKLKGPPALVKLPHRVHDKESGEYMQSFVSKSGLATFMRIYMHWKHENICKAMRMVFDEWNEEEEEEVPVSLSDAVVTRHISPPRKKRTLDDKMDDFLHEMRSIVTGHAHAEYISSEQFKKDCEEAVNARVDQMVPEIRAQLECEMKRRHETPPPYVPASPILPISDDGYISGFGGFSKPRLNWEKFGVVSKATRK